MPTENFGDRFRRWRRARPFWGGLVMLLSGLEMFVSANLELDNIKIHIGPQGFYSYLLPVIMLTCGALAWFSPAQRLFYGIVGIITALYSFIGLNLGGWILGMMLGIVGGALVVAWGAPRAGTGKRPTEGIPPAPVDPTIVPGIDPEPGHHSLHRKALLIMAPLLVAATVAVAGNRPAEAAECPAGLPSRKASASPGVSPSRTTAKPTASATVVPSTSASASPSASPAPTPTETSDHPILDGINDFWEGVGDLIGIGGNDDEQEAEPTPSATPTGATTTAPAPAKTPTTSPTTATPTRKVTAKPEEIPCLGARQVGLLAEDGGIPLAAAKPGVVKAASVTMYNSSYDGVAEVPTANGPVRSLKFTMDKVVNTPFSLTIDEPGDATTIIESGELILDGDVEFYSPTFKGKLFGLIPVTFTPEQPPPLTLPVLWFTDVTLDLAYVKSNALTAEPLDINEKIG
ncbi:hypothetical protein Aca07nite_51340 [Actinoplanes capillaceus]|uniref:Uncharacterized protein n=1 Tax=Actinoplanes campanulatus TaxID=113559 RepID=A0ABQ3WNM9_9ACTN|nr:DUF6114 domain-containing protein [Actinoplanes capillaceus]GID47859.1 hypothetical protein Aca07nite_51340 [Actinoplanes capillaceus]